LRRFPFRAKVLEDQPSQGWHKMMGEKDLLWYHLQELPYFRSLLRAVEARFYHDHNLTSPVLDVGCGDGHFARAAFDRQLDAGIDPESSSLRQANRYKSYKILVQAFGNQMPFPDAYFGSVVSNSVLEHIPDVEAVLDEVARVTKPGGLFLFCVPNDRFLDSLSIGRVLDRIKLRSLGKAYRSFFNRISRHQNCDPPEIWQTRLNQAGFELEQWWHYFPPEALHILEWGHYFGLPSLVSHRLTGRWILAPHAWNLALTRRLVQPYFDADPVGARGVYSFFIARRN